MKRLLSIEGNLAHNNDGFEKYLFCHVTFFEKTSIFIG